ncbi:hypothetical protein PANT_22c00311 [Moesziomyces antarcticus T-34]|uniref:Metaxin glutathione S-transferase domain-containing protein n=1 Tax=Pseudozyma antarctica (strain T-34) TaxID=1151754 RepID=M9MIH5_PSEA3|nr:hypothetical protein PANT_22c00311 [Moesziomyces antarcticus T-34]
MTTTQAYPELEEIPPAPRRSRVSSHAYPLIPQWVASVFATFPLHTFPLAKVYSPSVPATPTKPTLYVAPHLNRDGTLSATSDDDLTSSSGFIGDEKTLDQQTSGWSSSDPIALRWQMEFVFRQADIDVRFIDPSHNWGPAKSMPFLHLPPSHRSPSNSTASSVPTALLPAVDFAHHLDNYYPLSRPELGEKSANAWTDDATRLEARTWENLLQGRVMAGVLLAVLLSPQSSAYARAGSQPYLSSLLSTHLQNSFFDQQLRRISALNPSAAVAASASQPTTSLPGWEVGFLGWIGATTASATSALAAADLDSRGGGDTPGAAFASPEVDQGKVVSDAVAGLQALAARTKAQLEQDSKEMQPLLGASRPTSLDALAFSIVHTVLTLAATPQCQGDGASEPLRKLKLALDQSPWLVRWSRNVWKAHVKHLDLS